MVVDAAVEAQLHRDIGAGNRGVGGGRRLGDDGVGSGRAGRGREPEQQRRTGRPQAPSEIGPTPSPVPRASQVSGAPAYEPGFGTASCRVFSSSIAIRPSIFLAAMTSWNSERRRATSLIEPL